MLAGNEIIRPETVVLYPATMLAAAAVAIALLAQWFSVSAKVLPSCAPRWNALTMTVTNSALVMFAFGLADQLPSVLYGQDRGIVHFIYRNLNVASPRSGRNFDCGSVQSYRSI
nr:hypothetical protein [Paenibacillus frigoriresistens]